MALHLALLEPLDAPLVGAIARHCASADASLHLVGPLPYDRRDSKLIAAGPEDWGALDWWVHPGWRDFRDAMARERCLYFASDAERDLSEAPIKGNSVLVIGNAEGILPERIVEKYPRRIYRLPPAAAGRKKGFDLASSVAALLKAADAQLKAPPAGSMVPAKPMSYGRGRGKR